MVPHEAVLLVGHGSRNSSGNEEFLRFAQQTRESFTGVMTEACFIELAEPDIPTGLDTCVRMGAREVVVLPVMLFAAGHVKVEISSEIDRARARHRGVRFRYGRPFGVHPKMLEVLEQRLEEIDTVLPCTRQETAVLLVGRGSSDPDANGDLYKIARLLWERVGCGWVETCFIGIAQPDLAEGIRRCVALGARRILVLPYLLFTGVLVDRIRARFQELECLYPDIPMGLAPCLGGHPKLLDVLRERCEEACHETALHASSHVPILAPGAIEAESFRIIERAMGPHDFSTLEWPVVQRVIHATADFDLGRSLAFHLRAVEAGIAAIRSGCTIVADVRMVEAGISAALLEQFGGHVCCYMADPDLAAMAKADGTTRAIQCMRKAAREAPGAIYAIGNAPTALVELVRLVEDGEANVSLVIGVPVGFVAAAESKEQLRSQDLVPYITNHGRKGGTPVAVSIVNALLRLAQGQGEEPVR